MSKEFKNTINSVREDVQFGYVDNTSTSLLRIGGAFLFAAIQPFKRLCDYIDINQLRETFNNSYLVTSTELMYKLIKSMLELGVFQLRFFFSVGLTVEPTTHDFHQLLKYCYKTTSEGLGVYLRK